MVSNLEINNNEVGSYDCTEHLMKMWSRQASSLGGEQIAGRKPCSPRMFKYSSDEVVSLDKFILMSTTIRIMWSQYWLVDLGHERTSFHAIEIAIILLL